MIFFIQYRNIAQKSDLIWDKKSDLSFGLYLILHFILMIVLIILIK